MSKTLWCWRCRCDVPMLDESEWQAVTKPWVGLTQAEAAQHAASAGAHGLRARENTILAEYRRITGFAETNPAAILHHRLAYYGPPCARCGKPLRTPRASFCAACGHVAPSKPTEERSS